jgi:hypothetical protein
VEKDIRVLKPVESFVSSQVVPLSSGNGFESRGEPISLEVGTYCAINWLQTWRNLFASRRTVCHCFCQFISYACYVTPGVIQIELCSLRRLFTSCHFSHSIPCDVSFSTIDGRFHRQPHDFVHQIDELETLSEGCVEREYTHTQANLIVTAHPADITRSERKIGQPSGSHYDVSLPHNQ